MALLWEGSEWTFQSIKESLDACEEIGNKELGMSLYPNQIEIISSEMMLDAYTSVGMPIYYNHWSFGKHFSQQSESYKKGYSGLAYELVINSNPCINYLMEDNSMTTQCLVLAHAGVGHNHFFKNNYMFRQWTHADAIIDYLVFAKQYVARAEEKHGRVNVERFLDACHALSDYGVNRYKRPAKLSMAKEQERQAEREAYLESQVSELYRILPEKKSAHKKEDSFPKEPEENILYFCEKFSPTLKPWQRELIRIVRKIAQYFYPQGQTKVMNEGCASIVHYKIMNRLHEKGLISDGSHLEFLAMHSGVLYQPPFNSEHYSGFNPYKLGFEILRDIERICSEPTEEDAHWFPHLVGENGWEMCKEAIENYRDESFIRQFLSPKLMRNFRMFHLHDNKQSSSYAVSSIHNEQGYQDIRETLANQYERHYHVPHLEVIHVDKDSQRMTIQFKSEHRRKLEKSHAMMNHLRTLWGRDVRIVNEYGVNIFDEDINLSEY